MVELIFRVSSPLEEPGKTEVLYCYMNRRTVHKLYGGCDSLADTASYSQLLKATAHRMLLYAEGTLWSVQHQSPNGVKNTIFVGTRVECQEFGRAMLYIYLTQVLKKGHQCYDTELKLRREVLGLHVVLFEPTLPMCPYNKCEYLVSQMPVLKHWRTYYL